MLKLSVGQAATLACALEVSAPKPGNVHRAADFDDLSLEEMLCSAVAIAPAMEAAANAGVGPTVLRAVKATRSVVRSNTNLGTILLLAPLASTDPHTPLRAGVPEVLGRLQPQDATAVYQAIRLAEPGGMGHRDQHDIHDTPPADLIAAMRSAAKIDLIAAQYAQDYDDFFGTVVPCIHQALQRLLSPRLAIVHAHLQLMARFPDSLICRKRGMAVAEESAARAQRVLDTGPPNTVAYQSAAADLDFWLRCDGNARNPGTTADFIAAGLFACLREGLVDLPSLMWSDVRS